MEGGCLTRLLSQIFVACFVAGVGNQRNVHPLRQGMHQRRQHVRTPLGMCTAVRHTVFGGSVTGRVGGRIEEAVQQLPGLGRDQGGDQGHAVGLGLDLYVPTAQGLGVTVVPSVRIELQQQPDDQPIQLPVGQVRSLGRHHRLKQPPSIVPRLELGPGLTRSVQLARDQTGSAGIDAPLLQQGEDPRQIVHQPSAVCTSVPAVRG